jgi:Uma2 family endonuclease
MATVPRSVERASRRKKRTIPPLENGDHLDQKTFHERYEAMPPGTRAELIGGVVFIMPSPQKIAHGESEPLFSSWLNEYRVETPGTRLLTHSTTIMGRKNEPQPDACLVILPECGGQPWGNDDDYLHGVPELLGEVSSRSESIDLHEKLAEYEKAGVLEYVVVALRTARVYWFVRRRGKFKEMKPGPHGIYRSEVFPGLWLDAEALLRGEWKQMAAVLRQGLASPEHAAFVGKLAAKRER